MIIALFSGIAVSAAAVNVSRSYSPAEAELTSGMLVSLGSDTKDTIFRATTTNADKLVGVVVASDDSLMAMNVTEGKVQVAVNGTANVLVSTIGGAIKVGDQISVSPLSGIGMKAEPELRIIGIAQQALSISTPNVASQDVTDKKGKRVQVKIASIPVAITIGYAPALTSSETGVLGVAQRTATTIVGHPVSTPRLVMSMIIASVAIIGLITLVYGAIRGSLVSIGRNPLAKSSIYRTLSQAMLLATLLVVVAVVVIYFILR